MATYTSLGRTNHFAVKDLDAFRALISDSGIELEVVVEKDNVVVLLDTDGSEWAMYPEDSDDCIYLYDVIAEHLPPGEVVIFQSVGNEKFRYLNGYSVACDAKGGQVWVHLSDIYDRAAEQFGVDRAAISLAEY